MSFYHNDVLVGRITLIRGDIDQPKVTSVSVSPLELPDLVAGLVIADKKLKMYQRLFDISCLMREVEQLQIYKLTDGKNCTVTEYVSADSDYGIAPNEKPETVVVLAACGIAATYAFDKPDYSFLNQSTIEQNMTIKKFLQDIYYLGES
ncbi:hypothetical protein SPFM1_00099 [Salmonella phage SPFM1]|nr:hypothetical protein SPFM1_00099 [Salmonella phage SPFM1]